MSHSVLCMDLMSDFITFNSLSLSFAHVTGQVDTGFTGSDSGCGVLVYKRSGCMCLDNGSLEACCSSQCSRDLSLFLNDSVVLGLWGTWPELSHHWGAVGRNSGLYLLPLLWHSHTEPLLIQWAFFIQTRKRCITWFFSGASALFAVVTDLTPLWALWLPEGVAAAPLGKRRGGGAVASFYSPAEWQLLWPQEAVQQTPTDGTSMGRQIVDVSVRADLPPLLLTTTTAKTNT